MFVLAAPSFQWLAGERVAGSEVHGTGSALAAAIAARLALGFDRRKAVAAGERLVRDASRDTRGRSPVYGAGGP
jgi:hydroxymethylpyrimidine/phosphomethylpyrimidine kinase